MRLEGSLDAFSLPDIFALLSMTKKTGGLHLRRDGGHGVVWVSTGSLTGGSSAIARQTLARRLVAGGNIDAETLSAAADAAKEQQISLASSLQQLHVIDEALLHELANEHIVDVVFDLLRWPEGDFAFVVDESNPDDLGVSRTVDDVVEQARGRLEEWEAARASLPGPAVQLRLAALPDSDVILDRDQWSMLALADGRRSVEDLVRLWGRGEWAGVRCLGDLVNAGVLCDSDALGTASIVARGEVIDLIEGIIPAPRAEAMDVVAPVVEAEIAPVFEDVVIEPAPEPEPVVEAASEPEPIVEEAPEAPVAEAGTTNDDQPDDSHGDGLRAITGGLGEQSHDVADVDHSDMVAAVAELQAATAFRSAQRDLSRVTPQRPEPFIASRVPEHPDGVAVGSTVGALAAAASPAPSSQIERDPSVNKSLLLRLIAGVRGL